jgi:hypothetical protein
MKMDCCKDKKGGAKADCCAKHDAAKAGEQHSEHHAH